jgi:hypothetical protein
MINFYKNNGVGTIQFASGEVVSLSDDVNIRADNSTNQIIISEFNQVKFWISTAQTLQVEGVTITGTNHQKVDLIAPVFADAVQAGGVTSYNDLTDKPTIPTNLDQIADSENRKALTAADYATLQQIITAFTS